MPRSLTEQQVAQYEREGVLFPLPALTPDEIAYFRRQCDDLEALLGGKPKAYEVKNLHLHFRWAYDLVTRPAVLDAVESVLGPDLLVWATAIFAKHPYDPAYVSWHQDGTYWGLDTAKLTSAWVALGPSHLANGCMQVVRGSHKHNILPHTRRFGEHNMLTGGQEVNVEVKDEDATPIILQPGQMSLHHVHIIHGSRPNTCAEKRVGFTIRYLTPAARIDGPRQKMLLVRGRDRYGHHELVEPPVERSLEDALAGQRQTAQWLEDKIRETSARAKIGQA